MEIVQYFAREWAVIGHAPVTFIIGALLLMAAAYAASSWRFGGIIESQRAQIDLLARKVDALPDGKTSVKRRAITDTLGAFLARGSALMTSARNHTDPPPVGEADKWLNELVHYLERELGTAYVARVNDGGSAPVGYGGSYPDHDNVYNGVRIRVFHLQEFLKELARPA